MTSEFNRLMAMDKRVSYLLTLTKEIVKKGETQEVFCANKEWYGNVKPALLPVVGWGRKNGPEDLRTEEAYDTIYQELWSLLPDCKGCNC